MSNQLPANSYPIYKSDQYAVTRQGSSVLVRELTSPELATVKFEGESAGQFESEVKGFRTELVTDLYLSSYFEGDR
jgi:hypothetical protein